MMIVVKKSIKPVNYNKAVTYLENKVNKVIKGTSNELIWFLEHPSVYTAGTSFNHEDILDSSIDIVKTSRGGKITWHGPGQLICYFVINLNKRKKDIRKFLNIIENSVIESLKKYNIQSRSDKNNIGIWVKSNNDLKKIGAIGIRVRKWIAYHGFSLNINNDLNNYNKIIPCGIKDRSITSLEEIKNQNYKTLPNELIKNLINNLKI